jgi:hypothetical protein
MLRFLSRKQSELSGGVLANIFSLFSQSVKPAQIPRLTQNPEAELINLHFERLHTNQRMMFGAMTGLALSLTLYFTFSIKAEGDAVRQDTEKNIGALKKEIDRSIAELKKETKEEFDSVKKAQAEHAKDIKVLIEMTAFFKELVLSQKNK